MILGLLDKTQQEAFVALAYKVILADYRVPDSEDAQFNLLKRSLGIGFDVEAHQIVGIPDVSAFDTRISRAVVLTSLLMLALSDGDFHISESDVLHELSAKFGFSKKDFDRLKDAAESFLTGLGALESVAEKG